MGKELGLKHIFQIQKNNDDFWYDREKFELDRNYRMIVVRDFILGIYDQTTKLMNAFDWKKHTLDAVEDKQNAIEQLIDINKYTIGLLMMLGIDSDEYMDMFEIKSNVLIERWESLKEKMTETTAVVCFDIDGVIANYDDEYKRFLKNVYEMLPIEEVRNSYSYYKLYGISKIKEEQLHVEFIQSGGFRKIKPYSEMVELIRILKRQTNIKIVLLTARPSWVYQRLITDTYWWLKEHKVEYDLLLWDKDKADTMVKYIFPANVLCFIEDRDKHAIEITHLGVDVLLLDKDYNQNVPNSEHIFRVFNVDEIKKFIAKKVDSKFL